MRRPGLIARVAMLLVCAAALTPVFAQSTGDTVPPSDYAVQPGDVLRVTVWKEENLDREVLVRPDGGVSFPLVGDVPAKGRTVDQLREEISSRLVEYIPAPAVTVSVKEINGNKVFVIGKVNRPGDFVLNRVVDVMQALSMAGGMTPFAKTNRINVLRRIDDKQIAIPFKFAEVQKGINLEQNILLQNGDIVVVP